MEEKVDKSWKNIAYFIFYLGYFMKDFYVAFSGRVQCLSGCSQRVHNIVMQSGMSRLFQLSFPELKTTSEKSVLIVTLLWLL